ncbi:hypothetical protein [Parabacteroides sp. Marseille-P3160]|uniref:hypothetical protein n=1 Tax=Parabacteroides sp. Marseille-P3160 TaxID=1917887 RepID=UPI0009BADE3D|nr:hypothetical protein [Parabacteroides sp. Marseille-P3160]
MNRSKFVQLVALLLFAGTLAAQKPQEETIYIKSPKFTTPLIEKWINEYSKKNTQVVLKIADKQTAPNADVDLVISKVSEDELQPGQFVSYIGRYALLPVANTQNPTLDKLSKKKLNNKRLKELFFEKDILDEDASAPSKNDLNATIYSGNNEESVASAFASHFGYTPASLKGKKISGDDIYLLHAIKKDPSGITFNNLSYIYDTDTRQLKKDLAIVPLDLKKEQREALEASNIDKTIALIESEEIDLIPVEAIGFVYQNNNPEIKNFLKWILSEGQTYNHQYGFLNPDQKTLSAELEQINKQHNNNLTSLQSK